LRGQLAAAVGVGLVTVVVVELAVFNLVPPGVEGCLVLFLRIGVTAAEALVDGAVESAAEGLAYALR